MDFQSFNMECVFSHFFPVKSSKKGALGAPKISPVVHNNLGTSFSKYESHEYLPMLDMNLWRLGTKICPIPILTFKVAQGQIQ